MNNPSEAQGMAITNKKNYILSECENGWIVNTPYSYSQMGSKQYVFSTLEEAVKEITKIDNELRKSEKLSMLK